MKNIYDKISYLKAKKASLKSDINDLSVEVENDTFEKNALITSRYLITEAQRITQENFKNKVNSLINLAIKSVFDNRNFTFDLEIDRKRNQIECVPKIFEGQDEFDPKDEIGGGLLEILSFAFRIVLWALEKPRSRNVFFLDEPLKQVGKGPLLLKAAAVLKEISQKLNIQLIIITHERTIASIADRIFEVSHDGTESRVKTIYMSNDHVKAKKKIRFKKVFQTSS